MLGNSVMAPRTVQSGLTKHTAPGTIACPGSGSARTRCVSWRPGRVTASTTVVTLRTKTSAVSLALPLLLKGKVVPGGLLSVYCVLIPVTDTKIPYLKTGCFLAIT